MDGGSGSIDKLCLTLATPWTVGFQALNTHQLSLLRSRHHTGGRLVGGLVA